MSFTDWKIDRIENILPEEFYKLIDKNRNHIGHTFPVTLANSDSPKNAENFISVSRDKEKNSEGYYFYARETETNNLIGYLCVKTIDYRISKCELGYFIDEDFQGKGITSKMVSDALEFCFNELKMNKVFICTSEVNLASQKIALKHNFKQEGILRDEFRNGDGQLQNTVYFGLLKSEYTKS
ncbi:GNAT family N-acetyltransferase [Flavobacterium sp. S87F.05.LMB.W.Kidney.N]|uniref:GNAT family N-acetyltransferase n=1 Tax=Flavobacterium sp. S87F.05.LMB.W.Kidney.N TaxID=1278758 RepID=UPI0010653894|nr:GNAT family protein [Flavobacterium sp. S87F.05.LMB.W.Kidney.N]TDX13422.1 ribosomal-protein-serine acetyltransferase [Flavobacterium sp. S87F.05.LMB.W.Kidney.N]